MSGLLGEAEHSVARGVEPHITLTGSLREALLRYTHYLAILYP